MTVAGGVSPYRLHIGGRSIPAEGGRTYETINPFSGQAWARVADGSSGDIDSAVVAARDALDGPGDG